MSELSPYFRDSQSNISVYHGDCRAILPTLSPFSVDCILADPPYGDTSLDWDVRDLSWLEIATPLLKPTGSLWCFGSLRMFMAQAQQIAALGWRIAQDIIWEKQNGSSFHADRFRRVHEHVVQFYRADTSWSSIYKSPVMTPDATARTIRRKQRPPHMGNIEGGDKSLYVSVDGGPRLMRSVIYAPSCHGYAEHPTQKSLAILKPLIEYSCPPGGVVLDPTMGSGSTLVAAKQMGRGGIGMEISEPYCRAAVRRLSQEMAFPKEGV